MSKKILELAAIAALAPKEEDFSAEVVNEGVWMTEAHLNAIENKLTTDAAAAKKAGEDLAAATTAKEKAEGELKTANETIATQKTEIENLKAENKKLKEPAKDPEASAPAKDEKPEDKNKDPKAKYRMGVDAAAEQYATKK